MNDHQSAPLLGVSPISFAKRFALLLMRKRPYYLLIALGCSALFYWFIRHRMPQPAREYFTTFRVKYSDPKVNMGEMRDASAYRPDWAMVNPFDRDMAVKYFESTRIILDAGERLNYSVSYMYEGKDVYDSIPIDVRFTSKRDLFDQWTMTLRPTAKGVELDNIKGTFGKVGVKQSRVFVPYGVPTATSVGEVLITRLSDSVTRYPKIKLIKQSDVLTQDRYDKHLSRHMGSNLIELFLTANCTPKFAEDLFREVGEAYVRYARDLYIRNLTDYTARLQKAIEQIHTGDYTPDSLDLTALPVGQATRSAMLDRLETLAEQARANAVVLEQEEMLEQLDPMLIRSTKQSDDVSPFMYLLVAVVFGMVASGLLLVELVWRPRLIDRSHLLSLWPEAELLGSLGSPNKPAKPIQMDALRIRLDKHIDVGVGSFLITSLTRDEGAQELMHELQETYKRSSQQRAFPNLLEPLNESTKALEAISAQEVPVVLAIRSGRTLLSELKALIAHCRSVGIVPLIVWYDDL